MKKLILISFFSLLLGGCISSQNILSEGKLNKGMSKSELRNILLFSYSGDDPFILGGGSEWFSSQNKEIVWGEKRNIFFVFKNVSEQISCGILLCKNGNGTLDFWHSNLVEARDSAKFNIQAKLETLPERSANQSGRDAFAKRWNDPGYTEASWPQKESFWIFIKKPPSNADMYAQMACRIGKDEYGVSGFTITVWDFNKKQYGKASCY
jgi:hypothetical protein